MSRQTLNLTSEIYDYLLSISLRESEILQQLREETANHRLARMQISPEQGQFMALLLKIMGAKKVLEIGVFTGYSSTVMALALPDDGRIIACDVSEEFTKIALKYWEEAKVSEKINLHLAPALETLDKLIAQGKSETFDFAFIDADKGNYENYYEKCLVLLRQGGVIAVDNVLWSGRVADLKQEDKQTKVIRKFNQKLAQDNRIDLSLIPIGDGLTLARKKTITF